MTNKFNIILLLILCVSFQFSDISAQEMPENTSSNVVKEDDLNIKELILDHLDDKYEWHLFTLNDKSITIPLPIIVRSKESGWNVFSSSKLEYDKSL